MRGTLRTYGLSHFHTHALPLGSYGHTALKVLMYRASLMLLDGHQMYTLHDPNSSTYDECHAKIDLFEVKKIGNFLVFKMV